MLRVDAMPYVALVAHEMAGRNGAIKQLPGKAMGRPVVLPNAKNTVPVVLYLASPEPAPGRVLIKLIPKPNLPMNSLKSHQNTPVVKMCGRYL
jgi:hypothetical protein